MVVKCAVCGKRTVILYPHLWVYKRDGKYFCSYSCKRIFDKGEIDMKEEKTTKRNRLELGQKLLELISAGKSPIPYLAGIGYANPQMAYADIKKACIKADPSLADRFPESIRGLKKPVETPEGNATVVATKEPPMPIAGGEWEKMETPENPVNQLDFKIVGIEGQYGRFVYDKARNEIIWSTEDGEAAAMSPTSWRIFAKQMPRVVELLLTGVEL